MHTENTTSRLDEISFTIIEKTWPVYYEQITKLF